MKYILYVFCALIISACSHSSHTEKKRTPAESLTTSSYGLEVGAGNTIIIQCSPKNHTDRCVFSVTAYSDQTSASARTIEIQSADDTNTITVSGTELFNAIMNSGFTGKHAAHFNLSLITRHGSTRASSGIFLSMINPTFANGTPKQFRVYQSMSDFTSFGTYTMRIE